MPITNVIPPTLSIQQFCITKNPIEEDVSGRNSAVELTSLAIENDFTLYSNKIRSEARIPHNENKIALNIHKRYVSQPTTLTWLTIQSIGSHVWS